MGRQALIVALCVLAGLAAPSAEATRSGTLFSGPTSADPMSVYWNPAAMTRLVGTQGILFSGITFTRSTYDRDTPSPVTGEPYPRSRFSIVSPSPSFGVVSDAGGLERLRFGLGFTSPLLKGASWEDFSGEGQPSSSRYHLIEGLSYPFTISAAAAYRINRYVAVGGGIELLGVVLYQRAMLDIGATLNQLSCRLGNSGAAPCVFDAPLQREDPAYAAPISVDGVGWSVGAHLGVLLSPLPWLDLGAAVHTGNSVSVPLELTIDLPPAAAEFLRQNLPTVSVTPYVRDAEASALWPTTVTAGATFWALARRLELSGFIHWAKTSGGSLLAANVAIEQGDLVPANYELVRSAEDEWIYHVRCAYQLRGNLRVGVLLELTPTNRDDEWISPGTLSLTTLIVHLGVAWQPWPWLGFTAEYGHFFSWSRTVSQSRFAPNPDPRTPVEAGLDRPSATGTYRGMVDRVALGVTFGF